MLVIAAPGQGAQTPGFLGPWLELPGFAERLGTWSELAGCDLISSGTTASAQEIRDTAVAQPLIVAAALAVIEVIGVGQALAGGSPGEAGGHQAGGHRAGGHEADGDGTVLAAGHSVGELAAGVIAGVLDVPDALRLVQVRGRAMARAAAAEHTSMTAVLGGEEAVVLAAIQRHG